jgi:class 3 adenylate cyclase
MPTVQTARKLFTLEASFADRPILMTDTRSRRFFSSLIVFIPVCVLVYALFNQTQEVPRPLAEKGVIDLRSWNFADGSVRLNGEWAFSQGVIDPSEAEVNGSAYMTVPGIWNNKPVYGSTMNAQGSGTYTLQVLLPEGGSMRALNILTMSNAYNLFVDGKLLSSNGIVSSDPELSQPEYAPRVVTFIPDSSVMKLTVQISNFDHCKGGFWLPVEFGEAEQVQASRDSRVLTEMFLFGCLFMMALYHFGLFVLRRKDPTALFFGLMCFVISVRSLLTGEVLMHHIFPDMSWHLARRIEYILTFTSPGIYVAFCRRLFPTEWSNPVYRIIVGFGILLCLFVLVTPTTVFTNASYVFTGYAWLVGMITIWVFTKALRKKLDGAGIFLATTLFFLLTIVNDTLNQLELIHTGLYLSFGLLIVTFAQSFSLSSRFSDAFFQAETYARTFRKFVPAQFLNRIAKDGIHSIKPGNAERDEVTVLFSDIRSFTSIAESMSPDEVFRMLNKYLLYVEPPIGRNNGFIDKYMGDGIMALFEKSDTTRSGKFAIDAALQMQAGLAQYNEAQEQEGKAPLAMGIGLHTGAVIIGTIGANDRMDSTAIGDAVNLASRIEGMTKIYGVGVLTSLDTLNALEDASVYRTRFVDNVMAKGKHEPVQIWQVIGKSSDSVSGNYFAMLSAYNQGIELYRAKRIAQAKEKFEHALALEPDDRVSALYLERCTLYLVTGAEEHISGVAKLEIK